MILISPEMMTHFDEEADYDICDSKGWKKERKEGGRHGNFSRTSTGDIALQTSLSLHAQKRIKERNLKIVDALKGSKKAGVILSEDGSKVVTAVPEGWSKNAGAVQVAAKGESAFARQTRVPEMAKLPSGHCILVTIIPSNLVGRVLGQKHSNMRQLAKSRGASYEYQKADSKMIVWGPEEKAQLLLEDIKQNVNRFERVCGPPIPEDKLPAGQTKRVMNIPEENIGLVLGKEKKNLVKLREEHPGASIHFDVQAKKMAIWGERSEVDKVCTLISKKKQPKPRIVTISRSRKIRALVTATL